MAGEWAPIRLGTVCIKIGSGATPRGGSDVYLQNGPYALIRSQNVYNDGFHCDGLAFIGEKHAAELENVEVLDGDVLLNITGDSVARACQVDPAVLPARVNQHVAIIRPDPDKLAPRFLRYFLVSPGMQTKLLSWAGSGGTRHALTKSMIESFDLLAPTDTTEQRAIAHILGTLDDKIDLNRRMNETLEAIARALFKSWFVDFGPVHAKVEGCDPGLPKFLADLFADCLVDSELGEIPERWALLPLYDIATYINGAAYATFQPNDERRGLPIIKIAELKAGVTPQTKFSDVQMPAKYRIALGDILFSWSGNPDTSIDTFVWSGDPAWLNQHIFRVVPHHQVERTFVLSTLKHLKPVFAEIARNKQTTGLGHVTAADLKRLMVVRPDDRVMRAWNLIAAPLLDRVLRLQRERRSSKTIQDDDQQFVFPATSSARGGRSPPKSGADSQRPAYRRSRHLRTAQSMRIRLPRIRESAPIDGVSASNACSRGGRRHRRILIPCSPARPHASAFPARDVRGQPALQRFSR
jgi:type I restriction enzyme, S subunit